MPNGISRDRTALKINQGSIITLLAIAFALKLEWLVALVALVMIVGTVIPSAGAFKLLYSHFLRPLGIVHPQVVEEDNVQHLFAQGLGGVFLAVAFYYLAVEKLPTIGWILALLVVVLALLGGALEVGEGIST